MRVKLFFRWYDLWVGAYWSRKDGVLYVLPLPTLGAAISLREKRAPAPMPTEPTCPLATMTRTPSVLGNLAMFLLFALPLTAAAIALLVL